MPKDPYASWVDLYDVMIDWPARFASESPVILEHLRSVGAERVLDIGCGTGGHAWALAQRGYRVTGADASAAMIERAESGGADSQKPGQTPNFVVWDLNAPTPQRLRGAGPFDAVLCMGNSFAHVLRPEAEQAVTRIGELMRPGGAALFQMKNLHRRVQANDPYLPPVARDNGLGESVLFVRCYEFQSPRPGTVIFHLFTVVRPQDDAGSPSGRHHHEPSLMQVWTQPELTETFQHAGFRPVTFQPVGAPTEPFDPNRTEDFYLIAQKL